MKNRLVENYPRCASQRNLALPEDRLALIDLQLVAEAQRLGLTPLQIEEAAIATTAPEGPVAEYFNRQDQLYLSALMSAQFQRVRQYAPAVINALYRATATLLLALLFSFLILIDANRIRRGLARLKNSRVGDFYEEAAQPIRCSILVGRGKRRSRSEHGAHAGSACCRSASRWSRCCR